MPVSYTHLAQKAADRKYPLVLFAGNSLSSTYVHDLIELIGDKDFSVNVVSKSGTTTEPSIAFRIFKNLLIKKYGEDEANKRIYATTDKAKGALKTEADAHGYESFVIQDGIGGRYSVLSPVGLLSLIHILVVTVLGPPPNNTGWQMVGIKNESASRIKKVL